MIERGNHNEEVRALLLVTALLAPMAVANASDLGVQVIGGPDTASEPMSFDDIKIDKSYKIDGYATVTPVSFGFVDRFGQWNDGKAGTENADTPRDGNVVYYENPNDDGWRRYLRNCTFMESGNEAEFAWLKVDVLNLKKSDVAYIGEMTVKVVYDDEYEYMGWVRQFNYDYNNTEIFRYGYTTPVGWPAAMGPLDEKPIGMMYVGHYVFGCTLPNFVVSDNSAPLKIVIDIGGNELTYNIRK